MNVHWIQEFWINNHRNDNEAVQRHYMTIRPPGPRNIAVSAAVNVFGPGAFIEAADGAITGSVGMVAVGIKWYEYTDETGVHHVDNDYFYPTAIIRNCVGIQLEFALSRGWAGAGGTLLYFD